MQAGSTAGYGHVETDKFVNLAAGPSELEKAAKPLGTDAITAAYFPPTVGAASDSESARSPVQQPSSRQPMPAL